MQCDSCSREQSTHDGNECETLSGVKYIRTAVAGEGRFLAAMRISLIEAALATAGVSATRPDATGLRDSTGDAALGPVYKRLSDVGATSGGTLINPSGWTVKTNKLVCFNHRFLILPCGCSWRGHSGKFYNMWFMKPFGWRSSSSSVLFRVRNVSGMLAITASFRKENPNAEYYLSDNVIKGN
jgi:hypothetical protein